MSESFWRGGAISAALRSHDIGALFRAYRADLVHIQKFGRQGITQAQLGAWIGLSQAQVSRIEKGKFTDRLDSLGRWVRALKIPPEYLWFDCAAPSAVDFRSTRQGDHDGRLECADEESAALVEAPLRSVVSIDRRALFGGAAAMIIADGSQGSYWRYGRVGASDVDAVREMISLFSQSDQRRGGGHGRSAVIEYLRADVSRLLDGRYSGQSIRQDMLSAVGELAYLVGWMSFDDSDHRAAIHYFRVATSLASEADDAPLVGHILRAMAHQALDVGAIGRAYELASRSVDGDRYTRATPRERSLTTLDLWWRRRAQGRPRGLWYELRMTWRDQGSKSIPILIACFSSPRPASPMRRRAHSVT